MLKVEDVRTKEDIRKYIEARRPDVFIIHNNETGIWQWSVAVVEDTELWLDSFRVLSEAKAFCARHGLSIKKIVDHQTDRRIGI